MWLPRSVALQLQHTCSCSFWWLPLQNWFGFLSAPMFCSSCPLVDPPAVQVAYLLLQFLVAPSAELVWFPPGSNVLQLLPPCGSSYSSGCILASAAPGGSLCRIGWVPYWLPSVLWLLFTVAPLMLQWSLLQIRCHPCSSLFCSFCIVSLCVGIIAATEQSFHCTGVDLYFIPLNSVVLQYLYFYFTYSIPLNVHTVLLYRHRCVCYVCFLVQDCCILFPLLFLLLLFLCTPVLVFRALQP